MSKQAYVKPKLLILRDIFLEKTDENHPLTIQELITELSRYGISVERKTLYDDINTLTTYGLDIVVAKKAHANTYYVGSRTFQYEELQVLADAVASSKFITTKKSNDLIKKLQKLTSVHKSKDLRRTVYIEGRVKTFNEQIYYNINSIHNAISRKNKITFKYFSYDINKRKQYKNSGGKYSVSPYYLVWDNDNYYLVCYCDKHQNISRYRVDRMANVTISKESCRVLSEEEENMAINLRSTFGMYGGEKEYVTMEFDNDLINVILDRFGADARILKKTDNTFTLNAEVQISPPFWGWLFQFGKKAKVIAPESVVKKAKAEISALANIYNT